MRVAVVGEEHVAGRIVAGGATAALLVCVLSAFGAFDGIERELYDLHLGVKPNARTSSEIVIVAIDRASLREMGSWPWPRARHAEVIREIHAGGAKVIGVDLGFFEPDRAELRNDEELEAATRMAGNVVLPAVLERMEKDGRSVLARLEPLPELRGAAAGIGHGNVEASSDGIVRKVHLAYRMPDGVRWAFSLEILRRYLDLGPGEVRPLPQGALALGEIEIPVASAPVGVDAGGEDDRIVADHAMDVVYAGGRGTFRSVSARDVLEGRIADGLLAGRIVLYGGTAPRLFEAHRTPLSLEPPMPGVELQANVIDSILKRRFSRRAPAWLPLLAAALCAMAVSGAYARVEPRVGCLVAGLGLGAVSGLQVYLFREHGLWLDPSPSAAALGLSLLFAWRLEQRAVNRALDAELLALSDAAALDADAAGGTARESFLAAEALVRDVLRVPAAALLELDRGASVLMPTAVIGPSRGDAGRATPLPIAAELTPLLTQREPVHVEALDAHPLGALLPRSQAPLHRALLLPLRIENETVGALCLLRAKEDPFRTNELPLFESFAGGLERAWSHEATRARIDRALSCRGRNERRLQLLRVLHDAARSEPSLPLAVTDGIADGVIVSDLFGTIRLMSSRARELFGSHAKSAVGRSAVSFLRRFADLPAELLRERLERIVEKRESISVEIQLPLASKRRYHLQLGPLTSRDGVVQGIVAVLTDITDAKEMALTTTDLTSMVTHEIRTPLATIRGFAQILLQGGVEAEKAEEFLRIIHRQSNRLVHLVNDFLDVTRIESGGRVFAPVRVDLEKLIEEALADLQPLAQEKKVTLESRLPPGGLPPVGGDPSLVEQVLINLLSNAIKYSREGAWARVAASHEEGFVTVSIEDGGLGIPEDALPHVFEKFYRVRCGDRKDVIGTGLGLSLVKQILDLHGGTIEVTSEHGKGSTFTFRLPVPGASADAETERLPTALDAVGAAIH